MIQSIISFFQGLSPIVYVVLTVCVMIFLFYLKNKGNDKHQIVKAAREEVLKLFLYAEKQDLIGPEKMKWVVEQIYLKYIPDGIEKLIPQETVDEWVEDQYTDFKTWLNSEELENIIAPK